MTTIEITSQIMLETKSELEAAFSKFMNEKDGLAQNKSLLQAAISAIEDAKNKQCELMKSGASTYSQTVEAERAKEIASTADRDNAALAVSAGEIKVAEFGLQLSTLLRDFLSAKNKYLDAVANKCLSDFVATPDANIIKAGHLMAAKDVADISTAFTPDSAFSGAEYAALFASKIAELFQAGGKLSEFGSKSSASTYLIEQMEPMSTAVRVGNIGLGREKALRQELETKKKALPAG